MTQQAIDLTTSPAVAAGAHRNRGSHTQRLVHVCWRKKDAVQALMAALAGAAAYVAITAVAGSDAINALAALAGCASFVLLMTGMLSGHLGTFAGNAIASALLFVLAVMSVDRGVDLLAGVYLLHAFWGGARLFAPDAAPVYASQRLAWSLFNLTIGLALLALGV